MLHTAARPEPDTPLAEVTFCIVDLETTGALVQGDSITEIGAVLVRGGETLGTFQTFVHPGHAIPAMITYLTGITEQMVADAPRPEAVLPAFLEFARGAIIVGHNVRFDVAFLDKALTDTGYAPLVGPFVDTVRLARRLLRDEVPDCRLGTLAQWLRLDHHPSHRGLTDALATTDLLHHLIERAAGFGAFRLDDLLSLPTIAGHPHAAKLKLTESLPRSPGVYEFVDRDGSVVYVGKATNLRQRVRSYFGSDDRRTIRPMLTALHTIRHRPTATSLAAEIAELRLLHTGRPRFNRAGALPTRPAWLRLSDDAVPRLVAGTTPMPADRALGPFPTSALARRAQEAIETIVPIRRCEERLRSTVPIRLEPCPDAQLGVASCPCSGAISPPRYAEIVAATRHALCRDAGPVIAALTDRMTALAVAQRFEEAALVRDRIGALSTAQRDRAVHLRMLAAGRLDLIVDGIATTVDHGRLLGDLPAPSEPGWSVTGAIAPGHLAESRAIARWLIRHRARWSFADGTEVEEFVTELTDALGQRSVAPS